VRARVRPVAGGLFVGVATVALFASDARAGRPPEAIDADRAAAEAEVHDLERRARALDEQTGERDARLKRRLRALYKLSSGGYLRLLAGAEDAAEMSARHEAVRRVLARDLDELQSVREEARAVDSDHTRRQAELARTLELGRQMSEATSPAIGPPTGLAARRGHLVRPVPGSVTLGFGAYRDPASLNAEKIELSRRGVEMRTQHGESVRAVAAGQVRWVGEVPGLGRGIAVDHGDGYLTLTARLKSVSVAVDQPIAAGASIGAAAGPTVYFELAQDRTPINPLGWISPP
jgi:septal ring factor EnvC (AmiA/AmiB activator)